MATRIVRKEYTCFKKIPKYVFDQLIDLNYGAGGLMLYRLNSIKRGVTKKFRIITIFHTSKKKVLSWILLKDVGKHSRTFTECMAYTDEQYRGKNYAVKNIRYAVSKNKVRYKLGLYYPLYEIVQEKIPSISKRLVHPRW